MFGLNARERLLGKQHVMESSEKTGNQLFPSLFAASKVGHFSIERTETM